MKSGMVLKLFLLLFIFSLSLVCSKQYTDREMIELAARENSNGNPEKAVTLYEELLRVHPDSEHNSTALFMIGYVCANQLGNIEKAKRTYNEFLEKYPDSELASSVKFELANMGKSPEEIIK